MQFYDRNTMQGEATPLEMTMLYFLVFQWAHRQMNFTDFALYDDEFFLDMLGLSATICACYNSNIYPEPFSVIPGEDLWTYTQRTLRAFTEAFAQSRPLGQAFTVLQGRQGVFYTRSYS